MMLTLLLLINSINIINCMYQIVGDMNVCIILELSHNEKATID